MTTRIRVRLPLYLLVSMLLPTFGVAAEQTAKELVREALHREVFGLQAERDQLLALAALEHPDLPEANWHRGQVLLRDRWVKIEDIPALWEGDTKLAKYERLRAETPDTIQGHLQLAEWCGENRLRAQQRAHLERVLDATPDNARVRALLGYEFLNGDWRSQQDQLNAARRRDRQRAAMVRWTREIEGIRKLLNDDSANRQQQAVDDLNAIYDLEVIPVLEEVLAFDSPTAGMLVVEWLAAQGQQPAVAGLMRQAVLSPWIEVRLRAATELGQHDPVRYVPAMVAELATPLSMQFAFTPTRPRSMAYQVLFTRETQDQRQELMLQREYTRRARLGGNGQLTFVRALANALELGATWQTAALQQNARTMQLNDRITMALNTATDQQLSSDPQQWWTWWNDYQDVVRQGGKQTRRLQRGDQVTVTDIAPQPPAAVAQGQTQTGECFAAGTLVWTQRGRAPIEGVQVGDLVLAQDIESGELGYKPVLRTTVRNPEPLVRVEVEQEDFRVTRGHLFWVAGEAWQQAGKLSSSLPLHTARGVTTVLSVTPASEERTYNLDVADFHTYFVGESQVLSHDVTAQRPVDVIVPGLRP